MGRRVELLVVFSRVGSLALAVAAVVLSCLPNKTFTADQLVAYLALCLAILPFGGVLLGLQFGWLCLGDLPPTNVELLVMIAAEWVVACLTAGSACAALAVNQLAIQGHDCSPGSAACVLSLVAAAITCASGALGMLWILGSRFRPAQVP